MTDRDTRVPFGRFKYWLAGGERGISSEAIAQRLVGGRPKRWTHPYDVADLRRCVLLLDAVPEAREHIDAMADVSPEWARLVEHWDELERLLRSEMQDGRRWKAPLTGKRMKEVLDD